MKLGATFPQTEIGPDPAGVKAYAQAVEAMGFDYLLAYDHVLGADVGARPDAAQRRQRVRGDGQGVGKREPDPHLTQIHTEDPAHTRHATSQGARSR